MLKAIRYILLGQFLDCTSASRQSVINKVLAIILLGMFARGCVMNTLYLQQLNDSQQALEQWKQEYGGEVPPSHQQSLFQMDWLKQIPDVPAPLFALFFTTAMAIVVALWKRLGQREKENREMATAFLPILSEIRTTLSFLKK